MPIYEYLCGACGKVQEVMQKMSDPTPTECTLCGKGPLEKQMSMTSFALKGTGWYVTDFRGGSPKQDKASDQASSSSSTEKAPAGPDSPGASSEKAAVKPAAPVEAPKPASGASAAKDS